MFYFQFSKIIIWNWYNHILILDNYTYQTSSTFDIVAVNKNETFSASPSTV